MVVHRWGRRRRRIRTPLEDAMSRIAVPAREAAPAASQPLPDAVEKQLGVVPTPSVSWP
jgi:hypothetical protein